MKKSRIHLYAISVSATLLAAGISFAADDGSDTIPGPIPASVVRVVDGDTIVVRARIWLRQEVETFVRLSGIDTPEMKGKCDFEREQARKAQETLARLTASGTVFLRDISNDKYGGRVLARVSTQDNQDVSAALIKSGLARPYAGERKTGWCP